MLKLLIMHFFLSKQLKPCQLSIRQPIALLDHVLTQVDINFMQDSIPKKLKTAQDI